ncbi:MAG: hypothetical protein QG639_936 [Patescibacteria group bacterium]|nr:hypothetical protein [Patescibacteria group bacterium]
MSKKIPLILIVAILGLLSAGAMWFVQRGSVGPMLGGVYMGEVGSTDSMMAAREPAMMGNKGVMMDRYTTSIAPMPPMYYPYDEALDVTNRSVSYSAYHSVVVDNVDEYMRQMKEFIQNNGGTVLSYNTGTTENDYLYGSINARVPQNKFEETNNKTTENVRKVVNASVDMQDVTGQVVSNEEQIQKLQDQVAEQEIELDAAKTELERSRIELQIDRLERQIEQLQQSQQVVEDRVDYASINISASNREYYFNGNGPRPLGDVLREAWYSLRGTGFGILYFLIWVVVYAIIWVPVLLLARWIWGKVRPAASKTTSK